MSAGTFTPVLLDEFNGVRKSVGLIGSLHIGFIFLAGKLFSQQQLVFQPTIIGIVCLAGKISSLFIII